MITVAAGVGSKAIPTNAEVIRTLMEYVAEVSDYATRLAIISEIEADTEFDEGRVKAFREAAGELDSLYEMYFGDDGGVIVPTSDTTVGGAPLYSLPEQMVSELLNDAKGG